MKPICRPTLRTAFVVCFLVPAMASLASAADITVECASAVETWMNDVIPEFQKASGHNVKPTYDIINRITERVRKGDPIDWPSFHFRNGRAFTTRASSIPLHGL